MNFLCDEREIQILCMEGRNCEKLEKGEPTSRADKKKILVMTQRPLAVAASRVRHARLGATRAQRQNHHTAKGQLPFYAHYI